MIVSNEIDDFIEQIQEDNFEHLTTIVKRNLDTIKEKGLKCAEKGFYLIHKIFERCSDLIFIEDVYDIVKNISQLDKNSNEQNWLHCAAKSNSNEEVIKFLINKNRFAVKSKDIFNYTPIHYAFLNHHLREKYSDDTLKLLIESIDSLLLQADDGITPIELLCNNNFLMSRLMNLFKAKFTSLLMKIDDVKSGIIITEYDDKYYRISKNFWTLILLTNDKYRLIRYLKKFEYNTMMYVEDYDMINYIKRISDNGLGILTFIREKIIKEKEFSSETLFYDLVNLKEYQNNCEFKFCHTSIFLCLITGRLELVPCLLRYVQFDIVPYAMFASLICERFLRESFISDQIIKTIEKCKTFCENFSINVLSLVVLRDLSERRKVVYKYLTKQSQRFEMQNILEIAQQANCQELLALPICQEAINSKWTKQNKTMYKRLTSPFAKYIFSAITFLTFIFIFSSVILTQLEYKASPGEYLVYIYGFTYALEEIKQVIVNHRRGTLRTYFTDASNVMDILAILNLIGSIGTRIFITLTIYTKSIDVELSKSLLVVRCFLSLSFIFFTMRLLYFASIIQIFGPKLKMITQMVIKDLLPLIVIFGLFIFAFGVVSQPFIYPEMLIRNNINSSINSSHITNLVGDLIRRATFTIFDVQYSLFKIDTVNFLKYRFEARTVALILLLSYMVIVNIMLINLLIALFSQTVTEIVESSRISWKAGRYSFVQEYIFKSLMPPPFNIINIIKELYIYLKIHKCKTIPSCKPIPKKLVKKNKSNSFSMSLQHENSLLVRQNSLTLETNYENFKSYYILQAFALKNKRYKMNESEEDKMYETKVHRKYLDNKIDSKFVTIQDQIKSLRSDLKIDVKKIVQ